MVWYQYLAVNAAHMEIFVNLLYYLGNLLNF